MSYYNKLKQYIKYIPLIHWNSGSWSANSFLKRSSNDNLVSDEFVSSSKIKESLNQNQIIVCQTNKL